MLHKLIGVVSHNVVDTYQLEVEANTPEEAMDVAYEVLSEEGSPLVLNKKLRIATSVEPANSVALEFEKTETEEVFEDDGDDPDYA